jgi:hypothetical protein
MDEEEIKKVRQIIIDHLIIKNISYYKLRDIAMEYFSYDIRLINFDWDSLFRNEFNLICNRSIIEMNPGKVFYVLTYKNCCKECSVLRGQIFNSSNVPILPNSKCISDICRCMLLVLGPDYFFLDNKGNMKSAGEDKKAWRKWYLKNFNIIWPDESY